MLKMKSKPTVPNVDDDPRVEREIAKLANLYKRRAQVEAQLDAAAPGTQSKVRDQALALLEHDALPQAAVLADTRLLSTQLRAIDEAEKIQKETIAAIRDEVVNEIRTQLTPRRADLLAAIDNAVAELIKTIEAHEQFLDECEQVDIVVPQARIGGKWKGAMISIAGSDPRYLLERLREWRNEFKTDGFLHK
ncbi:MAG TPA: hypothetical protein PLJ47_00470 [Candidatus Hydrogenedentes bacterium]|nr:hypothetical protein [Candidatus Hydrogenedentota bacterium]